MYRRKNVVIVVMCAFILFMALGYAAFSTLLNINGTTSTDSVWNVHFTNLTNGTAVGTATNKVTPSYTDTTAKMNVNLKVPGDSMTYELTVTNDGNLNAIIDEIEAIAEGSEAIIYTISGLKIGDKLAAGESKVMTIKIEYDSSVTSQPTSTSKILTVNINCVQDIGQSITPSDPIIKEPKYLSNQILKDNTAYADNVASPYVTSSTGIDFSQISSDTNGKGLYYTNTNTESGKTTYYFRGNVTNNYVSFAGTTWRIVRINEDGSIRLVTQDSVGTSAFNSSKNDNAYVGYMYGAAGGSTYALTHANTNSSAIKTYLDTWYQNNLASYSSYLADAGFCNDRSVASTAGSWDSSDTALGYGTNFTYYGSYNRLENLNQPQYACPQSNDLFTTSSSSKGNKVLTNPIGLITADEVVYAGGRSNTTNENYYLVNGSSFWTISPYVYGNPAVNVDLGGNGSLYYAPVHMESYGVRPVINLKSSVTILGGNGTSSNPYAIA